MLTIAYDCESALIRPGRAAPELACVSYANSEGDSGIIHWQDPEAREFLEHVYLGAAKGKIILVGQNIAFDSAVTCANFPDLTDIVFEAYDAGGIRDTMLRQQLTDISMGVFRGYFDERTGEWCQHNYDLASLVRRAGIPGLPDLNKDEWRLTYGQLRDLPLSEWPQGAIDYSILDAVATLGVYEAQGPDIIPDELDECRAFFALQLASVWGMRTDPVKVEALAKETRERLAEIKTRLVVSGLVRADGTKDTKAAMERMLLAWAACGKRPRLTKGGAKKELKGTRQPNEGLCLDEDSCEACEDPLMEDYALYTTLGKMLSNDVRLTASASHLPIHPGYKLLETCRVASRRQKEMPGGGSIQNISRANRKRCPTCGGTGHAGAGT